MNLFDPKDYYGNDWPEKKCEPDCTCQDCMEKEDRIWDELFKKSEDKWHLLFPETFMVDKHGRLVIRPEVLEASTPLCDCGDPGCDGDCNE